MSEISEPSIDTAIIKLDKSKFIKTIKLCALKVPTKQITEALNGLKDQFLEMPHTKRVVTIEGDNTHRLLLLAECLQKSGFDTKWPDALKKRVVDLSIELVDYELTVGFDNLSVPQILETIIPADIGVPTSYETVGHIAHFNLRPAQIPYSQVIGEVIIDKFKQIKTVVNKLDKLHNVYRTPVLGLMAGENNFETIHREDKCTFKLNFQSVYFCSRLQNERDRVLALFKPNETVLDLFCGVGPLAVRAAKMGCRVIANDLNPRCYDYLLENADTNYVSHQMICVNNDARRVADLLLSQEEYKRYPVNFHHFDHVYMNLPVDNIEFCDVFRGLLKKANSAVWNESNLPMIHATGFVIADEDEACKESIADRAREVLPFFKAAHIQHFSIIKNVTATKKMFCVSFRLSIEDALADPCKTYEYIIPERTAEQFPEPKGLGKDPSKKRKTE